MDYRRAYWLLFLGAGLLYGTFQAIEFAGGVSVTAWTAVTAALAVLIVATAAYASANPDQAGGPTEPNVRFAIAVVAFLLMVLLLVERVIAF